MISQVLPGNHIAKKRALSLLAEGQAEPQPTSHQTGSMPPGARHSQKSPEQPAPRFRQIGLFTQCTMQERGTGGGRSLSRSPAQKKSLPRMLRAWGPSPLELTARHYWYLSGSCVSRDLTDKSLDSSVSLPMGM